MEEEYFGYSKERKKKKKGWRYFGWNQIIILKKRVEKWGN